MNNTVKTIMRAWPTACPRDHNWGVLNPQPSDEPLLNGHVFNLFAFALAKPLLLNLLLLRVSATCAFCIISSGLTSVNPGQYALPHPKGASHVCVTARM